MNSPRPRCSRQARCSSFFCERLIRTTLDRLRNYLTARDLSDAEVAGGLVVPRLASPLPKSVRSVAVILLVVFGVSCCLGALYVMFGGLAVMIMPIAMGRAGVGRAMITLFTVCVTFVASAILLLAARSAARVIRREAGSIQSLYAFVRAGAVLSVVVGVVMTWLAFAFFDDDTANSLLMNWPWLLLLLPALCFLLFAYCAIVLRPHARAGQTRA